MRLKKAYWLYCFIAIALTALLLATLLSGCGAVVLTNGLHSGGLFSSPLLPQSASQ